MDELNPCSLFICSYLFLVTEARNGCLVGLGVSTNAAGYFYSVLLQSALRKQALNPCLDTKMTKLHNREDDEVFLCVDRCYNLRVRRFIATSVEEK